MKVLLIILWSAINIVGLFGVLRHVFKNDSESCLYMFLPTYSMCNKAANYLNINMAGEIIMTILLTAVILPAVLIYYVMIFLTGIVVSVAALFWLIFRKRDL